MYTNKQPPLGQVYLAQHFIFVLGFELSFQVIHEMLWDAAHVTVPLYTSMSVYTSTYINTYTHKISPECCSCNNLLLADLTATGKG
jgi:hypothetical protein